MFVVVSHTTTLKATIEIQKEARTIRNDEVEGAGEFMRAHRAVAGQRRRRYDNSS